MKSGIYYNGKIYHRTPSVQDLTEGDWNAVEIYLVLNRHEWWAESHQEVMFESMNGKAYIKKLGDLKSREYVEKYCSGFQLI